MIGPSGCLKVAASRIDTILYTGLVGLSISQSILTRWLFGGWQFGLMGGLVAG